jgi:glycolate oxidase iron-sulfur subunit
MTGPGRELAMRAELAAKCRSCGTCRSVCPVFAELGIESSVARGKVALIRSVLAGELDLSSIFDERIQLCLNCKTCVAECPNGVRVDDLILAARSGLVEAGRLPFVKRIAFRVLLRRGWLLPPFGRFASFVQRWILRGLPQSSPLRILLPVAGLDRNRVFPEFAARSFRETMPEVVPAASGASQGAVGAPGDPGVAASPGDGGERGEIARKARRVGYFVGCATNLIYPESGRAAVDALTKAGADVVIPAGQGCCGTPVFNSGDFVTARALARRNIEAFRAANVDAIVTGCASCGLTLKREYEELLGFEGGMGIPVFDFTEFLTLRGWRPEGGEARLVEAAARREAGESRPAGAALESGAPGARIRVAFHDPCHLSRGQKVTEAPRALLRSLPWVEYVEMRDADRCCGGGGTFSLTHYDVSKAIGRWKVEAVREAGVDIVATECPACIMQLRDMLGQAGLDVAVVNVADVVAMGRGRGRQSGPARPAVTAAGSRAGD